MTGLGPDTGSRAIPVSDAPTAVVVWVHLIMAHLRSCCSESRAVWADLHGYRINGAYICKTDTMNEHEYVIIDLSRPGQKDHLILRLERAAGGRKNTSTSLSPSTTTILPDGSGSKKFCLPPSSDLSESPTLNDEITRVAGLFRRAVRRFTDPPLSRPFGISSNKYLAIDTVEKLDSFPKSANIVRTVMFNSNDPSKRPSLWDLMVLVYAIHEDSITYELFEKQCFWFADTISAILENWSETSGDITVVNGRPPRSRLLRRNKRSGSVGIFVVHRRDPDLVDKIWAKFRKKQEELDNGLHEYEAAIEELRRAEDLARQVEELKRQQEDSEREFRQQLLAKDHEWQLRLQQQEKENNQRMERLVRQRKQHATESQ